MSFSTVAASRNAHAPSYHLPLQLFYLFALLTAQSFSHQLDEHVSLALSPSLQNTTFLHFAQAPLSNRPSQSGIGPEPFKHFEDTSHLLFTARQGLTFDPCRSDDDCQGPRNCTIFNQGNQLSCNINNATVGCTCKWERNCSKRTDCPKGEICALFLFLGFLDRSGTCVSEVAVTDKPEWVPLKNGLTMDKCRRKSDCRQDRQCVIDRDTRSIPCSQSDKKCVCFRRHDTPCVESTQCDLGERCALLETQKDPACISDDATFMRKDISPVGGLLGLELCARKTDCFGDRFCLLDFDQGVEFCTGRKGCFCGYYDNRNNCALTGDRQCFDGEVCVGIAGQRATRCASGCVFRENPIFIPLNKTAEVSCPSFSDLATTPKPFASAEASATPVTLPKPPGSSATTSTLSASPTRVPVGPIIPSLSQSQGHSEFLEPSIDYSLGPSPGMSPEQSLDTLPSPSAGVLNDLSESDVVGGACVDAKALVFLDASELVFKKHVRATVLCDSNFSCATEGHMVNFRGHAMMMRTYCNIVECGESITYVNSPKYKRGLVLKSNTDGLYFTAFAARFATRTEEFLLSTIIHTGL